MCNQQLSLQLGMERKSVTLQCSFQGWFSSSGLGRGQCWFGGAEKIRLRLFSLGASNRIPIPRLLSLSILVSDTVNFPLQSSELLHDRIHIAVNSLRLTFVNSNLQLPPQIFYGIKVWRLARPLQDLNVLLLEPLLCCFGCVFWVIVMLEYPSTTHFQCPGWLQCPGRLQCPGPDGTCPSSLWCSAVVLSP